MGALFTSLLAKITGLASWLGLLVVDIFTAAVDLLKDAFSWLFEQVMSIVASLVSTIDVSAVSNNVGAWGSLPAEVLNILALLGVGQAVTIITAALGIRLLLQLIPFVRLGS